MIWLWVLGGVALAILLFLLFVFRANPVETEAGAAALFAEASKGADEMIRHLVNTPPPGG